MELVERESHWENFFFPLNLGAWRINTCPWESNQIPICKGLGAQETLGQEREGFGEIPTFPPVWTPVSMPLRCLHERWLLHNKEMHLALPLLVPLSSIPQQKQHLRSSYKFRKQVLLLALQEPTAARWPVFVPQLLVAGICKRSWKPWLEDAVQGKVGVSFASALEKVGWPGGMAVHQMTLAWEESRAGNSAISSSANKPQDK